MDKTEMPSEMTLSREEYERLAKIAEEVSTVLAKHGLQMKEGASVLCMTLVKGVYQGMMKDEERDVEESLARVRLALADAQLLILQLAKAEALARLKAYMESKKRLDS